MIARALCSAATEGEECASPYVIADVATGLKKKGHTVQILSARGLGLDSSDLRVDQVTVRIRSFSDGFCGAATNDKFVRWDPNRVVDVPTAMLQGLPERLGKGWMEHWPRTVGKESADDRRFPVSFLSDATAVKAIHFLLTQQKAPTEP